MHNDNVFQVSLDAIHLVLSTSLWHRMAENKQKYSNWPASPESLQQELQHSYPTVSVLLRPSRSRNGEKDILIFTRSYYLQVIPSSHGDAYVVFRIAPLGLREHDELARGAIQLCVKTWFIHHNLQRSSLLKVSSHSNGLEDILERWNFLEQQKQRIKANESESSVKKLTAAEENYLTILENLIDIVERIELEELKIAQDIYYDQVKPADKEQRKAQDVYDFHLAPGGGPVKLDMLLCLHSRPDIYGKVMAVEGDRFTLQFGKHVDISDIKVPDSMIPFALNAAYRAQREAIEILRSGKAYNPYLLQILVENNYQPYVSDTAVVSEGLNQAQLEALQKSLTVPDMLLVLAPPGTGKTSVISKVIQQHGRKRQRILVTAMTHQAIDNILARFNGSAVLRVGKEDRVSLTIRPHLIEEQARAMQTSILQDTQPHAKSLDDLFACINNVEQLVIQIPQHIEQLKQAEIAVQQANLLLQEEQQNIEQYSGERLAGLQHTLQQQSAVLAQLSGDIKTLFEQKKQATIKQQSFLIGYYWKWLSRSLTAQIENTQNSYQHLYDEHTKVHQHYVHAQAKYHERHYTDRYQDLEQQVYKTDQNLKNLIHDILRCIEPLFKVATMLPTHSPPPDTYTSGALQEYLSWFQNAWGGQLKTMLINRCTIMRKWRAQLQSRPEELYPMLMHRADVIGVTCSSVTAPMLADIDFDMVIVDEAGQINILDLLVPLVRARRALLIGDHQQLLPFISKSLQNWLSLINNTNDLFETQDAIEKKEMVVEFLTKSAFEILLSNTDPQHLVRFTDQYRMPKAIADFVSEHFYDFSLRTASINKPYEAPSRDPLFRNSLVFIDTASLPLKDRQEVLPIQGINGAKMVGSSGYINPLEARLIADVIEIYQRNAVTWVAIVPYKAQAQLIRKEVKQCLISEEYFDVDAQIATVESFHGVESDKVIFGFTRCNSRGQIGFLSERRRLNMALTRAKHQLVLVGDSSTLTQAADISFRQFAQSLITHVKTYGEYLHYKRFLERINEERRTMH